MTTIVPPPDYIVIPKEYIEQAYAPDKPRRALLASFIRILSLAWQSKYQSTPKLNEEELMEYLKLSRRQYYEQKADMELVGWLRSSHPAPGFVQFTFSRAVLSADQPAGAENRTPSAEIPLAVGGESQDLNSNPDSPLPPQTEPGAENRTFPSIREVLRHTDKLFDGSVVSSKGLDDRSPFEALAWCAYAYFQKGKLTGPAGLVRKRLLDREDPPLWTTEQWPEVLPRDFLEALDLVVYECPVCEAKFKKGADLEDHEAAHQEETDLDAHAPEHPPQAVPGDDSIHQLIGTTTPEQAWQSVLDQLQRAMQRAVFESWVRDTRAVRYGRNTLYVAVANAYARDWLESRLTSTVNRLMVGIMNDSVEVVFVVPEELPA